MREKMKAFLSDLDAPMTLTRRELLLGMTVTALSALVVGFVLAPPRSLTLGSNNQITANTGDESEKEAKEAAPTEGSAPAEEDS